MGTVLACIGCYCCLFAVRPRYVELLAFLANLIEIGFLIWGIVGIPWDDISTGGKVCYYITCGLIIITFILLIILMILRCRGTINSVSNKTGIALCISTLIFDFLAFVMIIISEGIILYRMWDLDDDHDYWRGRRSYRSDYFSDSEWAAATFSTSAAEIGILAHFYCVSFLLKLIRLKTPLSYAEYMDSKNNVSNNSSGNNLYSDNNSSGIPATTINVFNTPPNNQNQLTFLGYDKDGHPIYAGNNQFRMVSPPAVNQPYVVQPYINQPNINQNNNIVNNKNANTNNKVDNINKIDNNKIDNYKNVPYNNNNNDDSDNNIK